jgi:phosphate transport system protein
MDPMTDVRTRREADGAVIATVRRVPARRHLHVEIDELDSALMTMGALVDDALTRAVTAVIERDAAIAGGVVEGDRALNRLELRIRDSGHHILLTQAPVARDLRNVLAVVQMAAELERMGDHCVSIARETLALCNLPEEFATQRRTGIGELGRLCAGQLHDILGAILRRDATAARTVATADDAVDRAYHSVVGELLEAMRLHPHTSPTATHLLFVAHCLERIGDRITNLAEDIVYLDSGDITELG